MLILLLDPQFSHLLNGNKEVDGWIGEWWMKGKTDGWINLKRIMNLKVMRETLAF